jgi:hypothetical protein
MLRFLIALLREGTPAVCYWAVAERQNLQTVQIYVDENYDVPECDLGVCWPELSVENEDHAKEVRVSGLYSLDVHYVSGSHGWRSVRKGIEFPRERRI